jgi:hypothetical protein
VDSLPPGIVEAGLGRVGYVPFREFPVIREQDFLSDLSRSGLSSRQPQQQQAATQDAGSG